MWVSKFLGSCTMRGENAREKQGWIISLSRSLCGEVRDCMTLVPSNSTKNLRNHQM